MELKVLKSIKQITPSAWNSLVPADFPFAEFNYLLALEEGESVGGDSGWDPKYLTLWEGSELVGATPLYAKNNSYGETGTQSANVHNVLTLKNVIF